MYFNQTSFCNIWPDIISIVIEAPRDHEAVATLGGAQFNYAENQSLTK